MADLATGGSTANQDAVARQPAAPVARGPSRAVYLLLAGVFFGLGVLGAFLPLLPTTPFLLVTSYFLVRSSPSLNRKLLESRRFGPLIEDWHRHRALRPAVKRKALLISSLAVIASAYFGNFGPVGLAILLLIGLVGFVVVLRLPVISE